MDSETPLHEITLTRRVSAPVDAVWAAFVDESLFSTWFWPARLEPTFAVDARVGGRWRVASDVATMAVGGTFTTVDESETLAFSWRWEGESEETSVVVLFAPARERSTLIDVTHSRIASEGTAADLLQGWNDCLDRLPSALDH